MGVEDGITYVIQLQYYDLSKNKNKTKEKKNKNKNKKQKKKQLKSIDFGPKISDF